MSAAIEAVGLHKTYRSGDHAVPVLQGVDFRVERAASASVIGPSGSGKSTLLACLAGLDDYDAGTVRVADTDLGSLAPGRLAAFRGRHMGFVFQSYRLLPALSAEENVRVPLELAGLADSRERARSWLERVGLGHRLDHRPSRLSGGEQQRVALARALAPEPAVVFADEPTGNLDERTGRAMADLLYAIPGEHATALVIVTHDRAVADRAGAVYAMHEGRLVAVEASPAADG